MLNDVTNNLASSLLNGSLSNQNIAGVTNALKNTYDKTTTSYADLIDEGKISKEALAKYQQEQEISYYKSILNQMLGSEEETKSSDNISKLIEQVKSGDYSVDNSALAKSILSDGDASTLLG